MTLDYASFGIGMIAAAIVSGFTLTVGGPDTAVTAVVVPLAIGIAATTTAWMRAKKEATA